MKFIFKILTFSVVFYCFNSFSRTTFEQIITNKPGIKKTYAMEIAILIDKAADKYKVPANVLAAIAMTESSYVLNAVNARSNDYGLFQINIFNINAYGFSKRMLLTDLKYSVEAGAIVFQWFYKRYILEEAVKRYNCGTKKSCVDWKGPINYWRKVRSYM